MESIEIKGFLTVDYAHLEIKKINILIGAQAQGKSVIAKLVYFFKTFFPEIFIPSIEKLEPKGDIDKKCLAQFEQIFPRYTWTNQEFSIVYKYGHYDLSIIRAKINNKYTVKFNYSNKLEEDYKNIKSDYKQALKKVDLPIEENERESFFNEILTKRMPEPIVNSASIFIPASRSFFANLQKNIFSFLASNIDIDPLVKEFGSRYEQCKKYYLFDVLLHIGANNTTRNKVYRLVSDIVGGEYVHEKEQDWIVNKGKRTNLAHASSGQQESLPMLLILSFFPFIYGPKKLTTFFIEEPEAHLFPTSQKKIISLIATIHNTFGHSFFITTHSPYILTALNNFVVGQDAYDKAKDNSNTEQLKRLAEVLPTDELIRLEDVSAYTLNNGQLESIIDTENRLIGANLLDVVSDEFDTAFCVATDILYGEG